jgi:kynureninase
MSAIDIAALRSKYTVVRERAYLATQCLGPIPEEALADLAEYGRSLLLRNRGLTAWLARMDELTQLIEKLLHAPAGSVALRDSATAAQAAIASAIEPRGRRDRIVVTNLDFHSSRYLWHAQARRGFALHEVRGDVAIDGVDLAKAIDDRVAVVAAALVSPRTGALLDPQPVIAAARAAGAIVILDAYQAVGVVPIDVRALDVDVLVGGTHKWLCGGGTGLAFMYVRPSLAERLEPAYPGWIGHRELTGFHPEFTPAVGARRFQQGTPALEPIYTARAGLKLALEIGVQRIRARNLALSSRLIERADVHGLHVNSPRIGSERGGTVCFDVPEGKLAVDALAARAIDVDHRPGAGVRVAPHVFNTEEECDRVIAALAEWKRAHE